MNRRIYPILISKKEWERLKRQGGKVVPEEAHVDSREEYFDMFNKQSRKWIDLWPDSAEGVREKLEKQKKKNRKDNIAMIDAFRKSRKHNSTQEAVKKAKQLIFDDSCYGRQLISATIESRTIEEREAQIAFNKEIKEKETELEKNKVYGDSPLVSNLDHNKASEADRKQVALEYVKFNQEMELKKKETAAKSKAEKDMCETVDEDMVKKIRENKAKRRAERKLIEKQEKEEYEAMRREIEERRKTSDNLDNALIELNKTDQDRIKCKIDAVLKKIIEEKRHGERAVKFYKMIDEIQKAEEKKYLDFVEKRVKIYEERNAIEEEKEIEITNKKREERCKVSKENQIAAEEQKLYQKLTAPVNKCVCDTQTILAIPVKASKKSDKDKDVAKLDSKFVNNTDKEKVDSKDQLSFLKPRSKLVEALKIREKEPSGYTGTESTDQYFAQQATDAIQGAKHKYFARKVVDEYLKVNNLDPSNLAIPNY